MKITKLSFILAYIGVFLSLSLFTLTTYAYFTVDVEGESKDITLETFNENTNVIYTDTSNLSMVNSYTGDEIIKTFTVENTSDYVIYYDINLNNVINNFENKDDLVYEVSSLEGMNRSQAVLPYTDQTILSYVRLDKHEKHCYTLKITFLKTDKDQSNNMNKTFSSNITVTPSRNINVGEELFEKNTLAEYMFLNNKGILSESNEEGIYYTNSNLNGITTYYYYGSNDLNNNLVFNNMCFKIVRTTSDYGVRIIYNGKYENNTCSLENTISMSSFNDKSNYNAYVGYMYGDPSSNNYNSEHSNKNSSTIKKEIDSWFQNNFKKYKEYLTYNSVYCNNRKVAEFKYKNVYYGTLGYGNNNTGYDSFINKTKSYDCPLDNDKLSTNNYLIYPVSLITIDEVVLSGFNIFDDNFFKNSDYYTISPAYFNGSDAYVYTINNNLIKEDKVNNKHGVRPVITLNKNIKIKSGDGSLDNPFKIE